MTDRLTKSSDILGMPLVGEKDARLGTVREIFVDLATGGIEFIVVEFAGLLGGSGKYHPVPWARVRYDALSGDFRIEMTKERFKAAPSYDREQLSSDGYGWNEQATRYFSSPGG